jgi:hypothetical protein
VPRPVGEIQEIVMATAIGIIALTVFTIGTVLLVTGGTREY